MKMTSTSENTVCKYCGKQGLTKVCIEGRYRLINSITGEQHSCMGMSNPFFRDPNNRNRTNRSITKNFYSISKNKMKHGVRSMTDGS